MGTEANETPFPAVLPILPFPPMPLIPLNPPFSQHPPIPKTEEGPSEPVRIGTTGGERKRDRRRPGRSRDRGGVMSPGRASRGSPHRRMRENQRRRGGRRCRPVEGRSSGGSGRKLKLTSPINDGRRDFGERANNRRRVRSLKGRKIGTMMDGKGVGVMSGEGKKSRVIPHRDIRRRGVEVPINALLVAWKGGKNKNLGTGERRRRRGGGRSIRCRGEGREKHRRRQKIFKRIHNNFFCRDVSGERIATPSRQ